MQYVIFGVLLLAAIPVLLGLSLPLALLVALLKAIFSVMF